MIPAPRELHVWSATAQLNRLVGNKIKPSYRPDIAICPVSVYNSRDCLVHFLELIMGRLIASDSRLACHKFLANKLESNHIVKSKRKIDNGDQRYERPYEWC